MTETDWRAARDLRLIVELLLRLQERLDVLVEIAREAAADRRAAVDKRAEP